MKRLFLSLCVAISLLYTPTNTVYNTEAYAYSEINRPHERQIECLADNIYHESRGESYKGKVAVGFVTMNRTQSGQFPDDVCRVVKQKTDDTCQFSWYCQKKKRTHSNKKLLAKIMDLSYIQSRLVAEYVFRNYENIKDPTKGSLYFHSKSVRPKIKGKIKKCVVGRHIFYNVKIKS